MTPTKFDILSPLASNTSGMNRTNYHFLLIRYSSKQRLPLFLCLLSLYLLSLSLPSLSLCLMDLWCVFVNKPASTGNLTAFWIRVCWWIGLMPDWLVLLPSSRYDFLSGRIFMANKVWITITRNTWVHQFRDGHIQMLVNYSHVTTKI